MQRCDDVIRSDVVEALSRDCRFNNARITVKVVSGRVILQGDAPTPYTIHVAAELAAGIRAVVSVDNQLQVSRVPGCPDDALIELLALQILRYNASIGTDAVSASVDAGIVTLRGQVDAYWKRNHAESLMLDIRGVAGVDNRLAVVPDLVPQDAVIADDVKSAIARSACPGQNAVNVRVEQGLVTLTGCVPSLLSKRLTPHLAESILGVKGVIDKLEVARD